ncbi:MAG TPA: transglutaminase domain-containing protein [Candidatus Nitrosotalea sp.]|nr:transglutaminase domain-containing protein [Candidatus Nitrosotalea sp.]
MQSSCSNLDFDAIKNSFLFYKTITSQYNDPKVLQAVRELIPKDVLEGDTVPSIFKWFKSFMTWTPNQIPCDRCNDSNLMQVKIQKGSTWQVRKTEVHTCTRCGAEKIIPRYSDVLKIAETRYGRCGEWSILFGAVLNSVSIKSRIAYDYLDHCWNELFLDGKWFHADSTFEYPHSFDNPHYYEKNWKKQYVYVIAFSQDEIEDVTNRYTEQLDAVLSRRNSLGRFENINIGSVYELQNLYKTVPSLYA